MKTYIKIALFAVFLIALGGIFFALYLFTLKPVDLNKVRPDFVTTATDIQKAFDADEKAASVMYINKVVEVSGEIASHKKGEKNALNVSLKTGSDLSSVICTFPNVSDPTVFKTGNTVTIRGVCSGFLMDVLLNNCVVTGTR